MRVTSASTTPEILVEIGARIRRFRLQQNRTIQELAAAAGLTPRTIERAERGSNPTLETVIRVLRALNRIETLDAFLPAPLASPLEMAKLGGRERQRAGTSRQRRESRRDD